MKVFNYRLIIAIYLCYCCIVYNGDEIKFDNTILAVGFPYYKILMALGDCKETVLYQDQKAWSKVRLNRIVDIYYESKDPEMLVSRVEVEVVLNDTDCFIITRSGLGRHDFSGTLFIPTRAAIVLYQLYIYSCSKPRNKHKSSPNYKDKDRQEAKIRHEKLKNVYYNPELFLTSSEEDDRGVENYVKSKIKNGVEVYSYECYDNPSECEDIPKRELEAKKYNKN